MSESRLIATPTMPIVGISANGFHGAAANVPAVKAMTTVTFWYALRSVPATVTVSPESTSSSQATFEPSQPW